MLNLKRFFALFLAIFLIFSVSIVPVFATEVGGGTNTQLPTESEEEESGWFASFREKLETWFGNLGESISNIGIDISNSITNLKSSMSTYFTNLGTSIGGFFDDLGKDLNTWLNNVKSSINTLSTNVGTWFTDLGKDLSTWFTNLKKSVTDLSTNVGTWFTDLGKDLSTWFTNLKKSITDFSTNVKTWFDNFFSTLFEEIKSWFVPTSEEVSSKLDDAVEDTPAVGVVTGFIENIMAMAGRKSSSAPHITVDLSAGEGHVKGNKMVIDFSFLDRYITYIHLIMSAFLWAGYLFLIYRRLPDILSGAGMVVNDVAHLPDAEMVARQKANEDAMNSYYDKIELKYKNQNEWARTQINAKTNSYYKDWDDYAIHNGKNPHKPIIRK